MKNLSVFVVVAVAVSVAGCATVPRRDSSGRLQLDGNQIVHTQGSPYFCFSYVGNGQERHECSMALDVCQQKVAKRTGEKFEITGNCREGNAVFCFAWAEGEASHSECFETEPDCNEMSSETATRAGKDNVSACQHFERSHQSY